MAQVATQAPANLMEMFGSGNAMLGDIAMGQVNQNRSINNLNAGQSLQDMYIQQQKLPGELMRQSLDNQTLEAQLGGHRASSSLLADKASISRNTLADQEKQAISDIASKISTNHLLEAENGVKEMLTSPDPRVRAMGNAMFPQLAAVKEKKMQLDSEYARSVKVAEIGAASHKEIEKMGIDAGKYAKVATQSALARLEKEGDPVKRDAIIRGLIAQAQASQDADTEAYLVKLLEANNNAYNNQRAAQMAASEGKINVGAVAGMPSVAAPQAGPAPGQAPQGVQVQEPSGPSPADIKAAFGDYSPQKYQYRINPQTGKLQRKPL